VWYWRTSLPYDHGVQWPWQRRAEPRNALPSDPFSVSFLRALGIGSGADTQVTAGTAMSVSAVFRAVSLVSGTLGTLPLRTLQTKRDGTQERATSFLDTPGLDVHTPFEWKELASVCLLLHGNAYCQHVYNRNGALIGLNLLQPTAVSVERADRPGGRLYTVTLDDGQTIELDATRLTHIPGISLDGMQGVSPIALARLGISAARAGERAAHQQFTSGAMVAGLVTPEDEDLDPDEAKVVKESVNAAMTGPENAGMIAVINRRLKFQPWSMNSADAQFLQSRTFQIEEIGRWFGVPPHLLGVTEKATSWGQGIAEQNRGLARYTLQPWTTRIEQRLSLLVPGARKAEFDYAQLLAPAPEDEIRLLLEQLNGGAITPNEMRRIRNLPPLPGEENDKLRLPAGAGMPVPPAAPGAAPDDDEEAAA
jgi:HK97 family phage portal protein